MLRRLLPLLIVGLPALAEASAYQTFLERLDDKAQRLAQGGWTSRDLKELADEVAARPEADASAYVPFVRVLENVVRTAEPGGVISAEVKAVKTVASVAPRAPGRGAHHEAFNRAFAEQLVRASSGGVISKEIELARIFAGAAPGAEVPPHDYEAAYGAWSAGFGRVEEALARGGLISNEKKLLDLYRTLQPKRGAPRPEPVVTPPPTGGQERICGRSFHVADRVRRQRGAKSIIRTRRGEAIAIDDCRQSWLADDVVAMAKLGPHVVLLVKSGLALVVDRNDAVYRLARGVDRLADGGRRSVRITREGREQTVAFPIESGGDRRVVVNVDGRRRELPQLYVSTPRPIRGR